MEEKIQEKTVKNVLNNKTLEIVKLITEVQGLVIDSTNGKETIEESKDLFSSGFVNQHQRLMMNNKRCSPTEKTPVQVYEIMKRVTNYTQVFGSLGNDLHKLCLNQGQIINFCKTELKKLPPQEYRGTTFFLFNVNGIFFVALLRVLFIRRELELHIRLFGANCTIHGGRGNRIVVPSLT